MVTGNLNTDRLPHTGLSRQLTAGEGLALDLCFMVPKRPLLDYVGVLREPASTRPASDPTFTGAKVHLHQVKVETNPGSQSLSVNRQHVRDPQEAPDYPASNGTQVGQPIKKPTLFGGGLFRFGAWQCPTLAPTNRLTPVSVHRNKRTS